MSGSPEQETTMEIQKEKLKFECDGNNLAGTLIYPVNATSESPGVIFLQQALNNGQ